MRDDEDPKLHEEALRRQRLGSQAQGVPVSQRVLGRKKELFITNFIAAGLAEDYPCPREDTVDENFWDHRTGELSLASQHWGDRLEQLTIQIRRAYEVSAEPSDGDLPIAHVLAQDLLDSRDDDLKCQVDTIPFSLLAVDRLIAHVESLHFELSPRLTAAIARRAFLVLLNSSPVMEEYRAIESERRGLSEG